MYLSELSLLGGLLVLLFLAAATFILWLIDGRTLKKMLSFHVHMPHFALPLWLILCFCVLLSVAALTGCMVLSFPCRMFWPVALLLLACLMSSTPQALESYIRCLKYTEPHRRYLVGNGASHFESVITSVRRALRSAVLPLLWKRSSFIPIAMLALGCGLVASGTTLAAALVTVLTTWGAVMAAAVLSTVLTLWLADRVLFDKYGTLTPAASSKP